MDQRLRRCFHKAILFLWNMGKYKYNRLPIVIKIACFLVYFKTSCLSLSKIWNMLRLTFYLDDLLVLTNSTFKDHLFKLQMVLARLSTAGMRVNISKSKFFAEQIEYLVSLISDRQTRYSTYT
jgi:hypothetical protein